VALPFRGDVSKGTGGAVSELLASADLMARGFDVYRALSPNACFDLVAYRAGRLYRVEVTTATPHPSGGLYHPSKPGIGYDILAVVIGHEVRYVATGRMPNELTAAQIVRDGLKKCAVVMPNK
jgi:hypothetical protein